MATESGGDETGGLGDETGDKTAAMAGGERDCGNRWGNVYGRRELEFESMFAIFVWRALRNFAMADFEENVEEMVGMTREVAGGDRVRRGDRPAVLGTRPATNRRRRLVTNETAATGGVMYTDEGELEFDEDEMAALEGQRLVAEFKCGIY